MDKLKVTVDFQNKLCDALYNAVGTTIFNKLRGSSLSLKDQTMLVGEVEGAVWEVVKQYFDNTAIVGEAKDALIPTENVDA